VNESCNWHLLLHKHADMGNRMKKWTFKSMVGTNIMLTSQIFASYPIITPNPKRGPLKVQVSTHLQLFQTCKSNKQHGKVHHIQDKVQNDELLRGSINLAGISSLKLNNWKTEMSCTCGVWTQSLLILSKRFSSIKQSAVRCTEFSHTCPVQILMCTRKMYAGPPCRP
jgi:hypothetical protein